MRNHSKNPIAPFPDHINRIHFSSYVSGLVDGEGFFSLKYQFRPKHIRIHPSCGFGIALRADDRAVLELIHSFFQCGQLAYKAPPKTDDRNSKPQFVFRVQATPDLVNCIVPHFEQFPLFAKKQRDFLIWKEALVLCYQVSQRPLYRRGFKGTQPTWKSKEIQEFIALKHALNKTRLYESSDTPIPFPVQEKQTFFGIPFDKI